MKTKLIPIIAALMLAGCTEQPIEIPAYSSLTERNHPRLFASKKTFRSMKRQIKKGKNEILCLLHENAMNLAEVHGLSPEPIVYQKDASNKRILSVSRETITRIFSAAYAYRFTGDKKYLRHAEEDMNTVCAFKDWNPSHYLDCAEMATAVAIGYDWLYKKLQDSTKTNVLRAFNEKLFQTATPDLWWFTRYTNWNQVCNAGITCAALASYESHPEIARAMIERSVESNREAVKAIYQPIGAYPEGPVYWNYGNMFQTLMLAELESTLKTDFGIGEGEGFSNTGKFQCFTIGNTGKLFNYFDNLPKQIPNYPLWYLAGRFDCPEILYKDVELLKSQPYVDIESERLLPLYVICAAGIDVSRIKQPAEKSFFSFGKIPVAMVRTGWNKDDLYLGAKGGHAASAHGHIDAGEFVFDAYGVRWASDPARQEYGELENPCKQMGGEFWSMKQNSVRWQLFRFNNRQHNTLTINDKDHDVNGQVEMTATFDNPSRLGAAFDLTPLFWGDVAKAKREVSIREGEWLEVIDSLAAGNKPATVRWTLTGEGEPEITPEGIVLRAGGKEMLLQAEGFPVSYCRWSSSPEECGWATSWFDKPIPEHICGFTFTVPAGKEVAITTTLKKR